MNKTNKPLNIIGSVRAVGENDSRTAEFIISTESIDRHGTVIMASGWDLEAYRKNPVVAYQHETSGYGNSNPDAIIGTSDVRIEDGKLIGVVTFEPADINPLAEKIFKKIQHGTLRAASVGMMPTRGHWGEPDNGENEDIFYFTEQELLEWSVVNIPSNKDAIKRNYSEVLESFKKSVPSPINSNQKGLHLIEAQLQININTAK